MTEEELEEMESKYKTHVDEKGREWGKGLIDLWQCSKIDIPRLIREIRLLRKLFKMDGRTLETVTKHAEDAESEVRILKDHIKKCAAYEDSVGTPCCNREALLSLLR